ncbi:MAG: prepilin-type N-terminal cleavage/methylation domain-containing protein, partial [Verrucomicrobiota bacterium]
MRYIRRNSPGFSLVELLVVMSIIVVLGALSTTALRALSGAGTVTKAASDLGGFIELSRAYALANNTFVRVGFANDTSVNPPRITVIAIAPEDGTLQSDSNSDMSNATTWPMIGKPLYLTKMTIDDALNNSGSVLGPDTSSDMRPSDTDITTGTGLTRRVSGNNLSFSEFIQFQPSGEVRVQKSSLTRSIAFG